jgi:hypothetical protein
LITTESPFLRSAAVFCAAAGFFATTLDFFPGFSFSFLVNPLSFIISSKLLLFSKAAASISSIVYSSVFIVVLDKSQTFVKLTERSNT